MPEKNLVRDADGRFICPYNKECRCWVPLCGTCGWHPDVRNRRVAELNKKSTEEA